MVNATVSGDNAALRLQGVGRIFTGTGQPVTALRDVSFSLRSGTFTSIMGPSGSGKTTLLQVAAGLDRPTSGQVVLDGVDLTGLGEAALTKLRRRRIGFVFQQYNLLPALTVEENVSLPLKLARRRVDRDLRRALLTRVGLAEYRDRRPGEISGGQQQRAAIARTLLASPAVTFADEPTGALDQASARGVLQLLRESVDTDGRTVVMVTHDPIAASYADTVLFLADGRLVDEMHNPVAEQVAARITQLGETAAGVAS
ncbi:ABC transporter ATP-binding protein [Actinoplanes sp. NPDC051343]|uniref:ABC transporter ATP-binding protein n=1 Tax=Actinoplanes sp. NPDC051343 TaxID=3363906 RepID=UPI0037B54F95